MVQGDRPGAFAGDRWHPIPSVGPLRAARQRLVPVGDDDDRGAGGGRRRARDRDLHPAGAGRNHGRRRARRGAPSACAASTRSAGARRSRPRPTAPRRSRALKIVGPGSPWIVAAKRLLADVVDVGLPAGPSEAIVFADDSVDGGRRPRPPDRGRARPDSSAYLVTASRKVAEEAMASLPGHWAAMTRAARRVLPDRGHRHARRHRARAVGGGGLSLRQRLRAGASRAALDRAVRPPRPHHQRGRGADGAAHADRHRQFRARAERRAADRRLGADLRPAVGDRLHEARSIGYVTAPPISSSPGTLTSWPSTRASPPTRLPSRLCAKPIWAERAERESRTPPWQARLEGR